jgi:hypothetical protein
MQPALHAGHCLGAHTAPEIHTGRTFCAFPWAALLLVERLSRCIRLVGSIANLCVGAGEQAEDATIAGRLHGKSNHGGTIVQREAFRCRYAVKQDDMCGVAGKKRMRYVCRRGWDSTMA